MTDSHASAIQKAFDRASGKTTRDIFDRASGKTTRDVFDRASGKTLSTSLGTRPVLGVADVVSAGFGRPVLGVADVATSALGRSVSASLLKSVGTLGV